MRLVLECNLLSLSQHVVVLLHVFVEIELKLTGFSHEISLPASIWCHEHGPRIVSRGSLHDIFVIIFNYLDILRVRGYFKLKAILLDHCVVQKWRLGSF